MSKMKIVFLIVEGGTDATALGLPLENIFVGKNLKIHVSRTDITSDKFTTANQMVSVVGRKVTNYRDNNGLKSNNFECIIHLIDTDGTYILKEQIIEDTSIEYPEGEDKLYCDENIYTCDKQKYIDRNIIKKTNLSRLLHKEKIAGIPYIPIYMSSCLDHVLHDRRNINEEEKGKLADKFEQKYKDDGAGFVDFICNSDFSVEGDIKETWKYIQEGTNSLKRHTNLRLAIERCIQDKKAE